MSRNGRLPVAAAVLLLLAPTLFGVNYVAQHLCQTPLDRHTYTLVVVLLVGTLLPSASLTFLARASRAELERLGYGFRPIELLKIATALVVAGAIAAMQVGTAARTDPSHTARLFVWLIGVSTAEVLVFCGTTHNVIEMIAARRLPRWVAALLAAGITSLAFGFYHFSHAPPWNTLATAGTLTIVWLMVSAVFVTTRSLWAAAAFNTVMATTGFIANRVTRLDEQSFAAGLGFTVLSVLVVVAVPRVLAGSARSA